MALLQISEPGQTPDPHQRRIAVGIDLGTTHSLVAAVRNGVAECLPDATGEVILPSAVRYLEGQMSGAELADRMVRSWSKLMEPIEMERRYLDFISDPNRGRDVLRLAFTDAASIAALKNDRRFAFRPDVSDLTSSSHEISHRTC